MVAVPWSSCSWLTALFGQLKGADRGSRAEFVSEMGEERTFSGLTASRRLAQGEHVRLWLDENREWACDGCVSHRERVCWGAATWGFCYDDCNSLNKSWPMHLTKAEDSMIWSCASSCPALISDDRNVFTLKQGQEVLTIFMFMTNSTLKLW